MGLIVHAAQLVVCQSCRSHGRIIFGDGSKTEELHSKPDARAEVNEALFAKKIIAAEAEFLRAAIEKSALFSEKAMSVLHDTATALHVELGESAEHPSAGPILH